MKESIRKNNRESRRTALLTEELKTLIPRMAGPTIVAQLITTIYSLADTFFVSQLGTYATAAVGVNHSLERTITILGSLIGSGASSYIARLMGGNKEQDANRVLSASLFTGLGLGAIIAAVGVLLSDRLVFWLGATPECAVYARQYASYVLLAAPVMIGSFILNMCLRSEGSATLAMIGMGFGGLLNCALDPLFIFTLKMGVAGASLATAISKLVSFCILAYTYVTKKSMVRLSVRLIGYRWTDIKEVVSIGSTSFMRSALTVVAGILINRRAGAYSTQTLAALSLATRIMSFPFAVILGFGQGYQPVVGFNWGAKQYRRVKDSLRFTTTLALIGSAVMGGLLFVFARPVIQVFNSQADGEVLRLGMRCVRLQCLVMPMHSLLTVFNMFFAGAGKAKLALLLSTARQGYCLPPMVLLPALFGVEGMCAAQAAADLLTLLPGIPLMRHAYRLLDRADQEQTQES